MKSEFADSRQVNVNRMATRDLRPAFFRFSMRQFLVALILLIASYPFVTELASGELIENVLMAVLLISAALAIGGASWSLTILLIVPALICPWIEQYHRGLAPIWLIAATQALFVSFVVIQLLRFILTATQVNAEVLCAGISGYLMLGILWTPTFLMVSQLNPTSFAGVHLVPGQSLGRFDALFLSFVSLTCLGCNDITPLSKVARMLLMMESLTGVLYLAVLIARLVALYSIPGKSENPRTMPAGRR